MDYKTNDDIKKHLSNIPDNNKVYMMTLYNLKNKIEMAYGKEKLQDTLNHFEEKIYTVNGKKLNDKEKINLEFLRISNIKLSGKEYDDDVNYVLDELRIILATDTWNSSLVDYAKELILYLQMIMKLDVTMLSVVDNLLKKEFVKLNSDVEVKKLKSELRRNG